MSTDIDPENFEFFDLSDPKPPRKIADMVPEWAQPMLTRPDAWENYSDDLVYETDKRIREWIEKMRNTWSRRGLDRRYTFRQLVQILGIEDEVDTRKNYAIVSRVFAYYSTKIQKQATVDGKKKKNVYTISVARLKRAPYSLRLRMEAMMDNGDPRSLRLPKDDLEMNHARNKRTEANMRRRSEEARRRHREYQAERRERLGEETEE